MLNGLSPLTLGLATQPSPRLRVRALNIAALGEVAWIRGWKSPQADGEPVGVQNERTEWQSLAKSPGQGLLDPRRTGGPVVLAIRTNAEKRTQKQAWAAGRTRIWPKQFSLERTRPKRGRCQLIGTQLSAAQPQPNDRSDVKAFVASSAICRAALDTYIAKSIIFAKIFRLRVCSVCQYLLLWQRVVQSPQCGLRSVTLDNRRGTKYGCEARWEIGLKITV